jgi:hypothetical protein
MLRSRRLTSIYSTHSQNGPIPVCGPIVCKNILTEVRRVVRIHASSPTILHTWHGSRKRG